MDVDASQEELLSQGPPLSRLTLCLSTGGLECLCVCTSDVLGAWDSIRPVPASLQTLLQ